MNAVIGKARLAYTDLKCETCQYLIPKDALYYMIGERRNCRKCGEIITFAEIKKLDRFVRSGLTFDFQIGSRVIGETLTTTSEPRLPDFR